ncbi:MAG TPA: WD40 repeat domain-containing protein, partial [Parvularculaceae bacterium]|nr:WD40 repeat domain-containing protein [Parvularculaceae bacterium]
KDRALGAFLDTVEEAVKGAAPSRAPTPTPSPAPAPSPAPETEARRPEVPEPAPPKKSSPRKKQSRNTVTGSQVRAALFIRAVLLALIVAGLFAGLAYFEDFALPNLRPYFIAAVGALVFISRYWTFVADRRTGAASLHLISRSYFALLCAALITAAPPIMEARLYAAALDAVRMRGIEGADINAAAISADGNLFATASDDGTVRVWDTQYGVERAFLKGHENWVWGVAFDPSGKRVVSASRDLTARVWNIGTGKEELRLEGHKNTVYAAAYSPSGDVIATGSGDGTVRLWDSNTGKNLGILTGHSDDVVAVDFDPSGKRVASASKDGSVIIWSVASGQSVMRLQAADGELTSVKYSSSGDLIAAGSAKGAAIIWSTRDGRLLQRIPHDGAVFNVAFAGKGKLLLTACADGAVRIFDSASGNMIAEHKDHSDAVRGLDANEAANIYVSASRDNTAVVREITSSEERAVVGHIRPAIRIPLAVDAPPVLYASRAPTPVNIRTDSRVIGYSLAKGVGLALALIAIGLLLKGILHLVRLRGASSFALAAAMTIGVAYAALVMLTALPLEAFILWITVAFAPAVALAGLRVIGAYSFSRPN